MTTLPALTTLPASTLKRITNKAPASVAITIPTRQNPRARRRPLADLPCDRIETLGGLAVDVRLGHRRQLLVGRFFLVQRLVQDAGAVLAAQQLRPCHQRAVTG